MHRGSEGLEISRRIHAREITADDFPGLPNCLMGEFEDRRALRKEDLAIIKAVGLKCRGRKAYPLFRSYLPGYCDWFLTEEEAAFLSLAFEAAVCFVALSREQPDILEWISADRVMVYISRHNAVSGRSWTTLWLAPDLPPTAIVPEPVPEEVLHGIELQNLPRSGAWEVGSFILSNARITDRDRPYYPRLLLAIHSRSRITLASKTVPAFENASVALRDFIVSTINNNGLLPTELRVSDESLLQPFKPIAARFGIVSRICSKLPALVEARRTLSMRGLA